jgi:hypothetical protein
MVPGDFPFPRQLQCGLEPLENGGLQVVAGHPLVIEPAVVKRHLVVAAGMVAHGSHSEPVEGLIRWIGRAGRL